jgi:hypothetical protein
LLFTLFIDAAGPLLTTTRKSRTSLVKDRARKSLVIDDVDDEDIEAVYGLLVTQLGRARSNRSGPRPFTDVLFDRVFGGLPIRKSYVSLETMAADLSGLSVLVHEFTHFWTLSGALGGYFSEIVVQLLHLRISLDLSAKETKGAAWRDTTAVAALRSYFESRAKLECLWRTWEPWMEGVALFSELDLDLTEPGGDDALLPVTMLLAALPKSTVRWSEDGRVDLTADVGVDVDHVIARIRDLQRAAADARFPTIAPQILKGPRSVGNEDVYFVGLTLIRFLWRTWAKRCPAFENSVVFCRTLIWLTHSAFDDLVPDWRCTPKAFSAALHKGYSDFLAQLLDLPGEALAEVVELQKGPKRVVFDLWRYCTSARSTGAGEGAVDRLRRMAARLLPANPPPRAPDLWEARVKRLRREFKENARPGTLVARRRGPGRIHRRAVGNQCGAASHPVGHRLSDRGLEPLVLRKPCVARRFARFAADAGAEPRPIRSARPGQASLGDGRRAVLSVSCLASRPRVQSRHDHRFRLAVR